MLILTRCMSWAVALIVTGLGVGLVLWRAAQASPAAPRPQASVEAPQPPREEPTFVDLKLGIVETRGARITVLNSGRYLVMSDDPNEQVRTLSEAEFRAAYPDLSVLLRTADFRGGNGRYDLDVRLISESPKRPK
jgi:hypothetical protein